MNTIVLSALEDILGPGEVHARGNVQFRCPFCSHSKPKLSIQIDTGYWHCWVCNASGKSYRSLFNLLKVQNAKREIIYREIGDINKVHPNDVQNNTIQLPIGFLPLWVKNEKSLYWKLAIEYLIHKRKIQFADIVKYKIGYCQGGKNDGMVVFPNFDSHGKLNYYTTRSFLRNSTKKFNNPDLDRKNIIGFELQTNWLEPVILVESALDAITIRRNGVPLYGKVLFDKIKTHIIEVGTPEISICLDGDAIVNSIEYLKYFTANGIPVKLVELSYGEDPNMLGYDEIWKRINSAEYITSSDLFRYEMAIKL